MNKLETIVYNEGERLVPYVSHDVYELIRHRSSYKFFRDVISIDAISSSDAINIVDLGFGSGYGCSLLASLPNSVIVGVDNSSDCEVYARQTYQRENVSYKIADLSDYIPSMPAFDYVVSRGVLEHIPNGLDLIKSIKFGKRLIIDVPYKELPGNDHHVLHGIDENSFSSFENAEIFYEDLSGKIYSSDQKPDKPNLIVLALRDPSLPKISDILSFPSEPCIDNSVEFIPPIPSQIVEHIFTDKKEFAQQASSRIQHTDVILDIGVGIYPMTLFQPRLHIMAEPCETYRDILVKNFDFGSSKLLLKSDALSTLKTFNDDSVDSVLMLDVIEHLPKDIGLLCIQEMERVARHQIVIFTPYGFMPQEVSEKDAWNLSSGSFQQHLSGWLPDDFDASWSFIVSPNFHDEIPCLDSDNQPYGAFYAIKNLSASTSLKQLSVDAEANDFVYPFQAEYTALLESYKNLEGLYHEALLKYSRKAILKKLFSVDYWIKSFPSSFIRDLSALNTKLFQNNTSDVANIFEDIYTNNTWGSDLSHSGCGSDLIQTKQIIENLPQIIANLSVNSILDIPCGDFFWMQHVNLDNIAYIGADIVNDLIRKNQAFASRNRTFQSLNLISDPLPCVDLIFCRDCLVHLSFSDIKLALKNIVSSDSKYLMTTFFTDRNANVDIRTGEWRPLNLMISPFNFPPPLFILNEGCTEYGSDWSDKSLGIWSINSIKDFI